MGLGTLGLSVAILGMIFVVLLYRGYRMASAYDAWQEVPCTVLSSWVEDVPQPGTTVPWYQFRVRYRYEAAGEPRVSDRVTDLGSHHTQTAEGGSLASALSRRSRDGVLRES